MIFKLLTEHHLEFLSLKGDCRGLSESALVNMSNCWKSHAAAYIIKTAQSPHETVEVLHVPSFLHSVTGSPFSVVPVVQPNFAIVVCPSVK